MRKKVRFEVLSLKQADVDVHKYSRPRQKTDTEGLTAQIREGEGYGELVLLRGFCPTGGYDLEVLSVNTEVDDEGVSIILDLINPEPDAVVTMMFTRPGRVVRIPKQDLPNSKEISFAVKDSNKHLLDRAVLSTVS